MSGPWIAAFSALCAIVLLLALVMLGTLRRISSVLEAAEKRVSVGFPLGGLSPGDPVPDFEATTADGSQFTASKVPSSGAIILFLTAECQPCRTLAAELAKEGQPIRLGAQLVVVLNDVAERAELGIPPSVQVIYQVQGDVSRAFRISGTPHAYVIRNGVVVASGAPNSVVNLRTLASWLPKDESKPTEPSLTRWERKEMIRKEAVHENQ